MGTWSEDIFGNDTACDWAAELAEGDSLAPVKSALGAVLDAPPGLLDADAGTEGLAAAETVARLRGHPGVRNAYTETLDDWVQSRRLTPPPALVRRALAAVDRIGGSDSELRDLWSEGEGLDGWLATLVDLRQRLCAPPRALTAPPPADGVSLLLRRVQALRFELPKLPDAVNVNAMYQQAVGATALGDLAAVREAIERLWQPVARLDRPPVAFDLAVRDAQTLAMEGRLDEALDGLEAWRDAPGAQGPGMFDMRAAGVCQGAGDVERMASLRDRACAAAPDQTMWRLDRPLFEARAGSAEAAQAQLEALGDLDRDATLRTVVLFIRGVLACRRKDPAALERLTPVAEDFAAKCLQGAAAWSLASAALGWWALALRQAGRGEDARAVAEALRPVLLQPHNGLLVEHLRDAGVLPADTAAPTPPPRVAFAGPRISDHGVFRSVAVRGVNALKIVEAHRRRFAAGEGPYPFLIGDDEDLRRLLAMIEPPADGGRAVLDAAAAVDATAWLKQHAAKRKPAWPREGPAPQPTPLIQFEATTQRLKPVLHVGLIDLADPCELFARLGWGGWNACPAPAVHVALHRHWRKLHGAEPVALGGDTVECTVAQPPTERTEALSLAREQEGYCPDIVEQGVGSTAKLGASLLSGAYWYFWWD